jgi:uncharacterized glyoxalase superfamily protein PhnB
METTEEIYPMHSFPALNVADVAESSRWYQEALGFRHVFTMDGPGGKAMLAHLRWMKHADILIGARPIEPGPRGLGITLNYSAYLVDRTVDEIAERAIAYGAKIAMPPTDMPWNARECTIEDPDGYKLNFTQPINLGRNFDEVIAEAREAEL